MFSIGDKVVYPMHGACIIEGIEDKEILGEIQKYYVLRFPLGGMRVLIPVKNVEDIGIRDVITEDEVDRVIRVLKGDQTSMPTNWNRRYRYNMEKIKSGDIFQVADVVRNLMIRDKERGLSTAERKLLNNAKHILISEIALCKEMDEEEVSDLVEKLTLA
ncbi:MAG: CarD family transcriptional regulator [Xylanivirga thermophila]|jgi:CarD family transcriptional regulator|uniref:CarD family transcriptional regulator n=1 Tax=Xylanivirga thermophila TaxID=2496273 RepID=UPI00101BB76F|nr:CarD family transcriptional regulator [Xylanivirga thermophila]